MSIFIFNQVCWLNPPVSANVNVSGSRVFADDRAETRSLGWDVRPYDWCPYKKEEFGQRQTSTEGRRWEDTKRMSSRSQGTVIIVLTSLSLYFNTYINSGPVPQVLSSFPPGEECGLSAISDSVSARLSKDGDVTELPGWSSAMSFPAALACSELASLGWKVSGDTAVPSAFSVGSCPPGPVPALSLLTPPSFTLGQHVSLFPSHPVEAGACGRVEESGCHIVPDPGPRAVCAARRELGYLPRPCRCGRAPAASAP